MQLKLGLLLLFIGTITSNGFNGYFRNGQMVNFVEGEVGEVFPVEVNVEEKQIATGYTNAQVADYIQAQVNYHNEMREKHNVPSVVAHPQLNAIAQAVAEKQRTAFSWQHSGATWFGMPLGENLYRCTYPLRGPDMSTTFYREISRYNFALYEFQPSAGHFSQVVWKESVVIGVGVASGGNYHYGVINYYPVGNNIAPGKFRYNVLPVV